MADREIIPLPPAEEQARDDAGNVIGVDRRLFMQLMVFRGDLEEKELRQSLSRSDMEFVLYRDAYDPWGVGLLTMNEDPAFFTEELRSYLRTSPFARMTRDHRYGMFGRSYTLGHEKNPEEVLLSRPRERASNPDWPWAIWYPLRRRGTFAMLPEEEQREILAEHGHLGMAFGRAGFGVDIRLASFGIDTEDNDFLIGLVGPSLHRLSLIVQTMRKTEHTARYLERLGPFFVGHTLERYVKGSVNR